MRDGEAVVQTGHASLGTYFWRAVYWFHEGLQENLTQRGLQAVTRTQAQVLGNLALGETRPTRLAKFVGISPQAMSQVLSELVSSGFIQLEADKEDARARVVRLTDAGLAHQTAVRAILHEMEELLEKRFGRAIIDVVRLVLESDWPAAPSILASTDVAVTPSKKRPAKAVSART